MMVSINLPTISNDGGLGHYYREVWSYPILEKQEEQLLGKRWRENGDTDAAHKLVTSHLR